MSCGLETQKADLNGLCVIDIVIAPNGYSNLGTLKETDFGYSFSYDSEYLMRDGASAVSLTLPMRTEEYTSKTLFSFLMA